MAEQSLMNQVDNSIGDFFSQWNTASTVIVGLLVVILIYPLFVSAEPDIHPFLLARQAAQSPIRYPGESATYRSTEIPYGYPLRSGLGIKDPGASKWTTGRDGDLRDIWRQAVNGANKEDGGNAPATAKITTVLGTEKVIQHDLKEVTKEINVIGNFIKNKGGSRVAVCLSNSVEFMGAVLASAFYSFSIILVPNSQNAEETTNLLNTTDFDTLIVEAGSISVDSLVSSNKSLRRIIWVVRGGAIDTDWTTTSHNEKLEMSSWHDLVVKDSASTNEVPPLGDTSTPSPIFALWPTQSGTHEVVEYTQANVISAVAALNSSLPRLHKLSPSDSVLPTTSLSTTYALAWSLLTLLSGSTLVLNAVAGPKVKLLAATKSAQHKIKPTHLIADARTIPVFTQDIQAAHSSGGISANYAKWSLNRSLVQGVMPAQTAKAGHLPKSLSKLKALYIDLPAYLPASERPTSSTLATLRLLLHARISLALTSGAVAGYVAQSNTLDYRDKKDTVSVGSVASSIELHLSGEEEQMSQVDGAGQLVAKGPAVVAPKGEKRSIEGVTAKFDNDNTIILVG